MSRSRASPRLRSTLCRRSSSSQRRVVGAILVVVVVVVVIVIVVIIAVVVAATSSSPSPSSRGRVQGQGRCWRAFQLAFILLSIPSTANKQHPDRKVLDLIWFPTGGGKTEAYLGLTAYVLALRRLQKDIEGRSGDHGIAVAGIWAGAPTVRGVAVALGVLSKDVAGLVVAPLLFQVEPEGSFSGSGLRRRSGSG
jgi:hypothetical protein